MINSIVKKKIAFCITCMNRLEHIQETLVKNMNDNFDVNEVEFILLDYNSSDGLEKWVKTLGFFLDNKMLSYYRTTVSTTYHRSHSRNMAFRLSTADIVCNLDADNFLGNHFFEYILNTFEINKERKIFVTSNFHSRDVFGRFCAYRDDFMRISGYDESLIGYGMEDIDLYDRLTKIGLEQEMFHGESFYNMISHSYEDRVSQEDRFNSFESLYLSYITPYLTRFLLLLKNNTYESGYLINNPLCNFNILQHNTNGVAKRLDLKNRIVLDGQIMTGKWVFQDNNIHLTLIDKVYSFHSDDSMISANEECFYKIGNIELSAVFLMYLSDAINFNIKNNRHTVNPNGFGKGIVYKNFDYTNKIILD